MVRPRISQAEARYLVEVLTVQLSKLEEKQEQLEMLRREFLRAKLELDHRFRGTFEMIAVVKYYKQVKEELERIESQSYNLFTTLGVHKKLGEIQGDSRRRLASRSIQASERCHLDFSKRRCSIEGLDIASFTFLELETKKSAINLTNVYTLAGTHQIIIQIRPDAQSIHTKVHVHFLK